MTRTPGPVPNEEAEVSQSGIVSVNRRGAADGNPLGKVFFVVGVVGLLTVAGFYGYNHYRAAQSAKEASARQTKGNEANPARAGIRRDFDKEDAQGTPPPVPGAATAHAAALCADGSPGIEALGPDGKELVTAQGIAMRVCADGHVIVPAIDGSAQPIGVVANSPPAPARPSRYAGEAMIGTGSVSSAPSLAGLASDPAAQAAYINSVIQQSRGGPAAGTAGPTIGAAPAASAGTLAAQLTPASTPMVAASMLGDRNMILPKGRSIDCGLSMRLVSDLPGLASCIVTQNVYSDNGKVLLLERGSEAVGEYGASMAQGQKRLFVLWTRIKTPTGVVINLDSPGADDLGTSGLPGRIDNHWWERLGAAALLTIVQDAIAYKTAEASNTGTGTLAVYQNTGQTTNNMADRILESTINIKPTLYKNQGDRSTIYVARDLNFSSVYALRPR